MPLKISEQKNDMVHLVLRWTNLPQCVSERKQKKGVRPTGTHSEAQTWHMSDLHQWWREQREPRPDASPIIWVEWTEHECSLGHSKAEVRRHTSQAI